MKKTLTLAAIASLLAHTPIRAQEKENELDPVTLTASITPQKASHTGRNLLVIRGERIASLPVHSIDELLRYLPGVEVQARGPMGAQSDIVMRGGTFQQVLVILDGLRINDPNTGHFASYIPISPAEIDRIEILKGAASAIYGSEAVGGVIQIITKTFSSNQVARSDFSAQSSLGQYGLFTLDAGGYFSNGSTSISAGILSNNASGQPQRGTNGSVYANTASFSFSHQFSERWSLKMRYSYDDRNFSAQNFYTNFISDTAHEKITSFWNQFGLEYKAPKNKLSLSFGYKDLEDFYLYNSVSLPNKNNSKLLQALLTDEWKIDQNTVLTSGAQFISKQIVSNDRGNHQLDQAAGFLIANRQLGEHFWISPALRLDWNESSGTELVPQVNLSYGQSKYRLRASAGKTIRDADFTERYNNYQKSFVTGGRIGNPDLVAEHSFSYEFGGDLEVNRALKLSASFFQRFHTNLIDYVNTPFSDMPRKYNLSPSGNYLLAKNISEINTSGVETDLQYLKTMKKGQNLWADLGLTWLQSNSSDSTPSLYISSHARFLANCNVVYSFSRFTVSLNGIYKNRKPQPATGSMAKVSSDYFVVNLKLEGNIWKNKLALFVEADNVFDASYADLLGAQMPGQWLMGGIKISLSKISDHGSSIGSIGNISEKWWQLNRQ